MLIYSTNISTDEMYYDTVLRVDDDVELGNIDNIPEKYDECKEYYIFLMNEKSLGWRTTAIVGSDIVDLNTLEDIVVPVDPKKFFK